MILGAFDENSYFVPKIGWSYDGGKKKLMNLENYVIHVRWNIGGSLSSHVLATPSREMEIEGSLMVVFGKYGTFGCSLCSQNDESIVDEVRALHKKGVYVFDFMNLKLGNEKMVKFWLDRWYEGGILKDLFPRMFALENMKEITVSSKLNGDNLAGSFRRNSRGGIEQTQFSKLVELVQSISLVPMNDRWVWNLESSGEFSVASIRRLIDEMRFSNIGDTTRWVKYVPIKVNILAWNYGSDVLL
ncbi:hypothetical protein Tco_0618795 [Tanacetum coccineum]